MKSTTAFEFVVWKMQRNGERLYFWTFTFVEVHSIKTATGLWNQFLTLLKRKLQFRGVRVLELHEDHGCHFHVITNKRYDILEVLEFSNRYGFGRIDVRPVFDAENAGKYLCKYLSKARPPCLKGARLWSAFGDVERTRVKDVLTDTPFTRILRQVMGKPSVEEELAGVESSSLKPFGLAEEKNFFRAMEKTSIVYAASFDPEYFERQAIWRKVRAAGLVDLAPPWSENNPLLEET